MSKKKLRVQLDTARTGIERLRERLAYVEGERDAARQLVADATSIGALTARVAKLEATTIDIGAVKEIYARLDRQIDEWAACAAKVDSLAERAKPIGVMQATPSAETAPVPAEPAASEPFRKAQWWPAYPPDAVTKVAPEPAPQVIAAESAAAHAEERAKRGAR